MNENSFLIITTDYNWDKEITPTDKQIGGKRDTVGEPLTGTQHLKTLLEAQFKQVKEPVEMFNYVPQNNRTGELKRLEVTTWQKSEQLSLVILNIKQRLNCYIIHCQFILIKFLTAAICTNYK